MSYAVVAQQLAAAHRRDDPATTAILVSAEPARNELRLIEVSAVAPDSGEVFPFAFAPRPDLGVPCRTVVLLLSPREWSLVQQGTLSLPEGWDLSVFRPV